jgi:hypothetical protein
LWTVQRALWDGVPVQRTVLHDLIKCGLRRPEFLIVDGAPGLDKAAAGCKESGFVVVLVMAWSPVRRFNAG